MWKLSLSVKNDYDGACELLDVRHVSIFSNDVFFIHGISGLFPQSSVDIKNIDDFETEVALMSDGFYKGGIIICDVDTKCFNSNGLVYDKLYHSGAYIVPVIDLPIGAVNSERSASIFVSKKVVVEKFIESVVQSLSFIASELPVLTRSEMYVVKELCNGVTQIRISKNKNVSKKTISSHKQSAMRKLGLTRLNAISLLWLKEIIKVHPVVC